MRRSHSSSSCCICTKSIACRAVTAELHLRERELLQDQTFSLPASSFKSKLHRLPDNDLMSSNEH